MAELPARDAALLLDMLLAARDARSFVKGLDEEAFRASRNHAAVPLARLSLPRDPREGGGGAWGGWPAGAIAKAGRVGASSNQ